MKKVIFVSLFAMLLILGSCETGSEATGRNTASTEEVYFVLQIKPDETTGERESLLLSYSMGNPVSAEWNSISREADYMKRSDNVWLSQAAAAESAIVDNPASGSIQNSGGLDTTVLSQMKDAVLSYRDNGDGSFTGSDDFYLWDEIGKYVDGEYTYTAPEPDENNWFARTSILVYSGYIVAANWNPISLVYNSDKKTSSKEGYYKMYPISTWYWWEQAYACEDFLIKTQDPVDINYTDEYGRSDAVTGASIAVSEFFQAIVKIIERR